MTTNLSITIKGNEKENITLNIKSDNPLSTNSSWGNSNNSYYNIHKNNIERSQNIRRFNNQPFSAPYSQEDVRRFNNRPFNNHPFPVPYSQEDVRRFNNRPFNNHPFPVPYSQEDVRRFNNRPYSMERNYDMERYLSNDISAPRSLDPLIIKNNLKIKIDGKYYAASNETSENTNGPKIYINGVKYTFDLIDYNNDNNESNDGNENNGSNRNGGEFSINPPFENSPKDGTPFKPTFKKSSKEEIHSETKNQNTPLKKNRSSNPDRQTALFASCDWD